MHNLASFDAERRGTRSNKMGFSSTSVSYPEAANPILGEAEPKKDGASDVDGWNWMWMVDNYVITIHYTADSVYIYMYIYI